MPTFITDETGTIRLTDESGNTFIVADIDINPLATVLTNGVPGKHFTKKEYREFLTEIQEEALAHIAAAREAERERAKAEQSKLWEAQDKETAIIKETAQKKFERDLDWSRFETYLASSGSAANLDAIHRLRGALEDIKLHSIGMAAARPRAVEQSAPPPAKRAVEDEYTKFGFSRAELNQLEREAMADIAPYLK